MRKRYNAKLIIITTIGFMLLSCGGKSENGQESIDKSGKRIVETGELAAIESRAFIMPRFGRMWFTLKVIGLLKHGSIVKAGDSIIQLDPADVKKMIIDKKAQLETQQAVIEKLKVDQNNKEQELSSQLKSEIATFSLRKLEVEAARFESERIRKIKQLEFNQAKIYFTKVQRQMKTNKIIMANDMKIQLLRANQLRIDLQDAKAILPKLTIKTPISGIFQIGWNRRTWDLIKIGDEIYPGANMGNVPDLTWMKVNSTIGERDFLKIGKGQKVIVRLDALPKIRFEGEVTYISKLCHLKDEKSKQKVFDVEVKMLKSDERLKPGMTVSCEYIL
jgi:multidrug efflux pump subunit AcrA (membrane-fusion protein)